MLLPVRLARAALPCAQSCRCAVSLPHLCSTVHLQVVDVLAAGGVKFIAMRCAGFDRVGGRAGGWVDE